MQRQTINIGNYTFIADYVPYNELNVNGVLKEFVIYRNLNFEQGGIVDNDLYFIERDSLEDISFPIPKQTEIFSTNKEKFFEVCNDNIYEIYDNSGKVKLLKYDVIRLYHPSNKSKNLNLVVYIDNIINNVHMHYYCKPWNKHISKSETEFKFNNSIYSEYIEICIPNLDDLFNKDTFIKEDTCTVVVDNSKYTDLVTDGNYISCELFELPFTYKENVKTYLTYSLDNNPYSNYPLNILLYPYSNIIDDIYIADDNYISNSDIFVSETRISISANLGFIENVNLSHEDAGEVCINMQFEYPNKEQFSTPQEAYEYYYRVDLDDYVGIEYDTDDEHFDIDIDGRRLTSQYQCAYILELASDPNFKNIIYSSPYIEGITLFNAIYNVSFPIPVFNSWDQLPEILVARVVFLDRYLGLRLYSNFVLITKEWYKYLVKYDNNLKSFKIYLNKMEDGKINFNNRVSCIIKQSNNNTNYSNTNISNTPTIIYKPIFYKVQELQNIQLYSGVVQNIGINLNNFMSKVETFYININGQQFIETARNGVYVIFSINTNNITIVSGNYHITNQDQEYISSGEYSII